MILCNTACSASSVGAGLRRTPAHRRHRAGTAVQHQAVTVDVQIGGRADALDQRDRAAASLVGTEAGLLQQVSRDHAVHHLQHGRRQLGLCG